MIERLKTIDPYDETEIDMDVNSVAGLVYENTPLIQKINELVDVVNELQATISKMGNVAENGNFAKNAQDPYAEQRKWIGKLCRVRDKLDAKWNYRILKSVDKTISTHPFWDAEDYEWEICEPVSQDDFVIYKGE